jgi:hypothetical protein
MHGGTAIFAAPTSGPILGWGRGETCRANLKRVGAHFEGNRESLRTKKSGELIAMGIEKERITDQLSLRRGKNQKGGHLETLSHGLYFNIEKFVVDGRSSLGQSLKKLVESLLERFAAPVPAIAQLLAQRTAYKLLRAASFEAFVLSGIEAPGQSADADYLKLTGSIRADIQTLYVMSKDAAPGDKTPDLKEYLEMLKKASQATPINPAKPISPSDDAADVKKALTSPSEDEE